MRVEVYRTWLATVMLTAVGAASVSSGAEPVLLEGFEDLAKVNAVRGAPSARVALRAVNGAPYVTEGTQAGLIPPGTTVSVTVSAKMLAAARWLRIDTSALEPVPQPVEIGLAGAAFAVTMPAYVQPGADTLALPLSVARVRAAAPWPESGLVVSVRNTGSAGLIVDNMRLESAAEAPQDSVLLDFGPSGQVVWPGFTAGGRQSDPIAWGSSAAHPGGAGGWPDPLGRDFVGPVLGSETADSIMLSAGAKSVCAWLWLTHYGSGYMQPRAYAARLSGRTAALMQEQFSQSEMFGPRMLLEGAGGAWTPQWFDQEYAGQFVREVQVTARSGTKRRIDLQNCQLAAAAMAPLVGRSAMSKYVEQVHGDLSRYRRQFVVGATHCARCGLAPTAMEKRTGMMVFVPPPDGGLAATWSPRGADRPAGPVTIRAGAGMDVVIPLVVVPLRVAKGFSILPSLLRSSAGQALGFEPKLTAYCVQRVARVVSAGVEFQPWVLVPPARLRAEVGDVCLVILKGRIRPGTQPGKYRGSLAITRAGLRTTVSLVVDVLGFSVEGEADPIIGAAQSARADHYYHAVAQSLAPTQQVIETAKVRRQLFTGGMDAMLISGMYVTAEGAVSSSLYAKNVKGYPAELARGATVLDASYCAAGLQTGVSRMLSVASAEKITRRYLLWRNLKASITAKDKSVAVALEVLEKGSPMLFLRASALLEAIAADASSLAPWSALLVYPDAKGPGKGIAQFTGNGKKRAYIYSAYPDRYLCGFYSCAVGASGSYVYGLTYSPGGGAYSGYAINGYGVLAVQSDRSLAPTMAMVQLWQARSDYQLMKSCQALLKARGVAAPGAAQLAAVLGKIKAAVAAHKIPYYDTALLRNRVVSPATMDAWRAELLDAAAKVTQGPGTAPAVPKP